MPDKPITMTESITHCSHCDEQKPFNVECDCVASKLARAERTIARLNAQLADSQRLEGEQAQRAERAESQLAELTEPVPCDVELVRCATFTAAAIEDRGPWVSMAIHKRVKSELAAAREALGKMRRYFWCTAEPGWVDLLMDAENECWESTRIAPPGRSEPVELSGRRSDDERQSNWEHWINAKRLAVLAEVAAALAAGKE